MAKQNKNIIAASLPHHSPAPESNYISDHLSLCHNQPTQHQLNLTTPSSKKPRGKPSSSKNRPKAPIIVTQQQQDSLISVVIVVPPGNDVIESIISYAQRRHISVITLGACGVVSNVTICHTLTPSPQPLVLQGLFTIMSLSGSYLHNYHYALPSNTPYSFSITVLGNQGQLLSGLICGKVKASNEVTVFLTVFQNFKIYRAPPSNNNNDNNGDNNKDKSNNNSKIDYDGNLRNLSAYGNNMYRFNHVSCQVPRW
ncbi:hypothetical protein RJT34_00276 [Clitoria ternatea]|uniref:PPC domain-containing protein n=1 Tax=Clitoria ternatea TaxID=43366 RepID=A0AAN9Q0K8_CLITE